MSCTTIVSHSRACGPDFWVVTHVYDHQWSMLDAANRFNGMDHYMGVLGVTQLMGTRDAWWPIIRLHRGRLGTRIVSHEMHHAACALYAQCLPATTGAHEVLTCDNERFAHLYSDLLTDLVDHLYAAGYYAEETSR